ncbi:MAG: ABC transporter permease subunit [Anaerolineaceae bacterium]|nr:ABC transporter permease subunit [Anaerolineaceae bacterium]
MKRLFTTFRYTFMSLRGQILGWGLGVGLYGIMIVQMFETMAAQQGQLQKMIANYPKEFLAFFGGDANTIMTSAGYLHMYAFSMLPIIISIYSILVGSGMIVSDEERGRLDLIIAHPVGRSAFFFGRFLGVVAAMLSILLIGWIGFSLLLGKSSLDVNVGQMLVPFISLFVQLFFYVAITLLLSMLLPSRTLAAVVGGVIVISSYMISSLAFMNEMLMTISKIMPYHYFQTVLEVNDLNLTWLFSLLGISLLMVILAWFRFLRRDIRLSGEGSWKFRVFLRTKSA